MKDLLGGKGANLAEMTNIGLPVPPGFTITTEACQVYLREGTEPPELAAKFSMPGMMDTVLNIGLNDASVEGLAKQSGNDRFAWDSYRRLVQMFGKTVLGVEAEHFDEVFDAAKTAKGTQND